MCGGLGRAIEGPEQSLLPTLTQGVDRDGFGRPPFGSLLSIRPPIRNLVAPQAWAIDCVNPHRECVETDVIPATRWSRELIEVIFVSDISACRSDERFKLTLDGVR